jgi:hypothetical protein
MYATSFTAGTAAITKCVSVVEVQIGGRHGQTCLAMPYVPENQSCPRRAWAWHPTFRNSYEIYIPVLGYVMPGSAVRYGPELVASAAGVFSTEGNGTRVFRTFFPATLSPGN